MGSLGVDDDSEEDIPLTAAAARIVKRATHLSHPADDDDEDKPLVDVINRARSVNFDGRSHLGEDEDEDERPLGLRVSRLPLASQTSLPFIGGEEDIFTASLKRCACLPWSTERVRIHTVHCPLTRSATTVLITDWHLYIYISYDDPFFLKTFSIFCFF